VKKKRVKKFLTTVSIVIAVILIFPLPMQADDGGTWLYKAIVYEVYDRHSIWDGPGGEPGHIVGLQVYILGKKVYDNTHFEPIEPIEYDYDPYDYREWG